ncbi:MAG: hypothetical protein JKY55_19435 [Aliivibrio sp.]|uniref:hypothetical protein n=1 Tax=Aliivibrio sp. TaxID=1872443 RepID=UPI001A39274A|nr:hypothetical protein [Aliivibrio sp.]
MKNKKWQKTSKIGKTKFVTLYGLLFFILSSSFYLLYVILADSKSSYFDHFIMLCILLISGFFWSFGYWKQMNKKYNS